MLVRLHYSCKYPDKVVEITETEWKQYKQLTRRFLLQDTEVGRAFIQILEWKKAIPQDIKTITVYVA